jgi:type I restriction enzyme S subunit
VRNRTLEIEVLTELRNTLLPKLISGELRIPDAEKFLEEVGI